MSPILLQIFSVLHGAPQCYQNPDGSPRFLVCTEADKARYSLETIRPDSSLRCEYGSKSALVGNWTWCVEGGRMDDCGRTRLKFNEAFEPIHDTRRLSPTRTTSLCEVRYEVYRIEHRRREKTLLKAEVIRLASTFVLGGLGEASGSMWSGALIGAATAPALVWALDGHPRAAYGSLSVSALGSTLFVLAGTRFLRTARHASITDESYLRDLMLTGISALVLELGEPLGARIGLSLEPVPDAPSIRATLDF
jgi:hypothetical protein